MDREVGRETARSLAADRVRALGDATTEVHVVPVLEFRRWTKERDLAFTDLGLGTTNQREELRRVPRSETLVFLAMISREMTEHLRIHRAPELPDAFHLRAVVPAVLDGEQRFVPHQEHLTIL